MTRCTWWRPIPPLTTSRQPVQAMAAAAITSLTAQIDGREVTGEVMLFEPELIVRGSARMRKAASGRLSDLLRSVMATILPITSCAD